ncbi:hypothetical protein Tco_0082950, partial [Tanacetum coccineum]
MIQPEPEGSTKGCPLVSVEVLRNTKVLSGIEDCHGPCKLKDTIKSLRVNTKEENVNHDKCDLEPINKELENSVAKLLSKNERMFKLDLVPLPPRLLQNMDAHIDYLRHTQKQANTLQEIVEQAKAKQPLDSELEFA